MLVYSQNYHISKFRTDLMLITQPLNIYNFIFICLLWSFCLYPTLYIYLLCVMFEMKGPEKLTQMWTD